jgi:hypothetical protein
MINVPPLKWKTELVNERSAHIFGISITGQSKYLTFPVHFTMNGIQTHNVSGDRH